MMTSNLPFPAWLRAWCLVFTLVGSTAFAQGTGAGEPAEIVSTMPMQFEAAGSGVSGQLVVSQEIIRAETRNDLVYTITTEPEHGRVGLAGGEDENDFYNNKTGRLGYFAYQPKVDYVGEDSFTYTVRNETSGLVFKNRVVIKVTPLAPLELDKFTVKKDRDRPMNVQPVTLTTRPNTTVAQKVPNHQDFMTETDRASITDPKVIYALDDKAHPQH